VKLTHFYSIFIILLWQNLCFAQTTEKIRWSSSDKQLKIVIELSQQVKYKAFTLKSPDRIVVDIEDTKWNINEDFYKLYAKSYIKAVRYGIQNKKNLRVVFDVTNTPTAIKTMHLAAKKNYNFRVVIDASFAKAIEKPPIIILQDDKPEVKEINPFSVLEKDIERDVQKRQLAQSAASISPKKQEKSENPSHIMPNEARSHALLPERKSKILDSKISKNGVKTIFVPEDIGKVSEKSKLAVNKIIKLKEQEEARKAEIELAEKELITKKPYVIVIDPGHGGNDYGATGKFYSTKEKDLTLDYALDLKKSLEENGKYKLILTRTSDKYLSLISRRNKARIHKADMFISLHADSNPDPNTQGVSVYTLSDKAYDAESEELSMRENKAEIIGGIDLSKENKDIANLLIDLVKRDTKNISLKFAKLATSSLRKETKTLKDAHRFAEFKVLKGIDIPAILIELGYISNKEEEKLLNNPGYKAKIIKALTRAINKNFESTEEVE